MEHSSPTPEEIRQATLAFQAGWTAEERRQREGRLKGPSPDRDLPRMRLPARVDRKGLDY